MVIRLYIKKPIRWLSRKWYAVTDRFRLQEAEIMVPRVGEVILVERMVFGCESFSSPLTIGDCGTYRLQNALM